MFRSTRILGVDIGASSVKVGEFSVTAGGGLRLNNFHWGDLGLDPAQEENRGPAIISTIQLLLKERRIKAGPAVISVSGQSVFTRFVKLPTVEEKKVLQIVKYEAAQNVPFPIEEVVWDYQLIGGAGAKELEVVLVAIKSDIIEELAQYVEKAGLRTTMVDVATMALYNSVRYNYGELDGCTLLLDVGGRTANLIFIEQQKIFTRNMPVAGNTITQAIAQELQVSFSQAEDIKRRIGFVGLGGAYEDPANEQAAKVSKIIRNVMTRLHAGISQTINFYRTQHGGNPPVRLLLSGGTCIIPYTDQFFREKLQIDVSYFNPFRAVELGPTVEKGDLAKCAHFFGEVVGLGLRQMSECPIEVNLVPKSVVFRKGLERKYPYFAGAAFCIVLALMCWIAYAKNQSRAYERNLQALQSQLDKISAISGEVDKARARRDEAKGKVDLFQDFVDRRGYWLRMFQCLHQRIPTTDLWLTSFEPRTPTASPQRQRRPESRFSVGEEEMPGGRGRGRGMMMPDESAPGATSGGGAGENKPADVKVEIIRLEGQGINDPTNPTKRYQLVRDFVVSMTNCNEFFTIEADKVDEIMQVGTPGAQSPNLFEFSVQVKLSQPVQVQP